MENEKRLIDTNDLFDRLYDNEFTVLCPTDEVCGVIDNCPTVDAVEVVRCKDCSKCSVDNSKRELHVCMNHPSFPVLVDLDDFCSYGERR